MYDFKVINKCIPEKVFSEACFNAVSEAKFKLGKDSYIPTELKDGIFCCTATQKENLEVMTVIRNYLTSKRFREGIDYTINVFIAN